MHLQTSNVHGDSVLAIRGRTWKNDGVEIIYQRKRKSDATVERGDLKCDFSFAVMNHDRRHGSDGPNYLITDDYHQENNTLTQAVRSISTGSISTGSISTVRR